ncbi:hypothetical protein vBBcePLY3_00019 [Bacillus phage vB_BceP_LY3]|uniref:Uncharacterized protein n=1 Tax=Bacillus phage vB_BceP_LY3 TaxID=2950458 RepID=A0AAE9LVM3_9CAUD|nr:hypothetical protein vBBcePLY3_00019 [Bacillus phage vB_BceP_LY3]
MCYNGKPKALYDFKKNGELVASGTIEEICKVLGISDKALYAKVRRTKLGQSKKNKYNLIKIKDSVHIYLLTINDSLIGEGTLKELSEMSHFTREHLGKIASGHFKQKNEKIKLYKRVG